MASLYLSDILKRNGFDLKRVKLIRHSLKDNEFKRCYLNGFMDEYQKFQKENFFNSCDFILSFINEPGTSAKFMGCYEVGTGTRVNQTWMPKEFPVEAMFKSDSYYFDLKKIDTLSDLIGRLIIDWGKAAISWQQWATNEKAVVAIQESPRLSFNGFENVVLSYGELKEIVKDQTLYENWHTALSSIYAIYLIADKTNGIDLVITDKRSEKIAVQAKCYADHNNVNVQTVRKLVGAKRNHDCILSLIITNSDLTLPAKNEAENFKVDYWHGGLLEQKLRSWGKWQPSKRKVKSV